MVKALFLLGIIASLLPYMSGQYALFVGLTFGIFLQNPYPSQSSKFSKILLQISVVGLGFSVSLHEVWKATSSGFVLAVCTLVSALLLGNFLGKILKVPKNTSLLISFGTAICGGSAIAALAPVLRAKSDEIAISLAVVFTLNALALFLFPPLGHFLSFTAAQFGLWAALAIHDTSSVVGAAAAYSADAVSIATTIKLSRAIWIIPFVAWFAWRNTHQSVEPEKLDGVRKKNNFKIPWFIAFFLGAATLRTLLEHQNNFLAQGFNSVAAFARQLLCLVLFLIGSSVNRAALRNAGWAPFAQAIILWVSISCATAAGIFFLHWT